MEGEEKPCENVFFERLRGVERARPSAVLKTWFVVVVTIVCRSVVGCVWREGDKARQRKREEKDSRGSGTPAEAPPAALAFPAPPDARYRND